MSNHIPPAVGVEEDSVSQRGRNGIVPRPAIERLRAKLAVNPETGCHEWQGALDARGYARITIANQRQRLAHRVAFEAVHGPIPDGLTLDHLCRNRRCCNPAHLEPCTAAENSRRSWPTRPRVTHCKRGHEFTPENTYVRPYGRRTCRACEWIKDAKRRK